MGTKRFVAALLSITLSCLTGACSKKESELTVPATPVAGVVPSGQADHRTSIPSVSGPELNSNADFKNRILKISNGSEIILQKNSGKPVILVEGTFTPGAFATLQSKGKIIDGLSETWNQLQKKGAIPVFTSEEFGYFTFLLPYRSEDLLGALKSVEFKHTVYLNPVLADRDSLANIQAIAKRPFTENLETADTFPRQSTTAFSGLERIGVPEFLKLAETEIGNGVKIDGSSVNVGVTDTGITYNHPSFFSNDGKTNRIYYLKDFTREGRVYFNLSAAASFTATGDVASDELQVQAQIIETPTLPALPAGDEFKKIENLKIKATPELKSALLSKTHTIRMGVFQEENFSGDHEEADINANGSTKDKFLMIFIEGANKSGQDVVYFDTSGSGDFSQAKPLHSFHLTGETLSLGSEKFGFSITDDKLPSAQGDSLISVKGVSIVGFDPGNHGSHVSGIIAGKKSIANDTDDTLARGVAPASRLAVNRVCANAIGCNAAQAMIDLAVNANVHVINMSLGGLNPFNDGYGVEETLVNRITSLKNILFMISAGNSGPGRQTVGSPSTARLSLSIGATATPAMIRRQYQYPAESGSMDRDFMLFFSSRGPSASGGFKPNLSAPGTELSAIQLNAAPGANSGMDVYWGTSMAAPTAAGAYALLLDAIHKYNATYPERKLTTDTLLLRQVLLQSARAFDVNSLNLKTGEIQLGRYTWADQGTGMVDLPSAWKKLFELRDDSVKSSVKKADGVDVELDFQLIAKGKSPSGAAYDGSRKEPISAQETAAAFAEGIYLDFGAADTLRQVNVMRRLPDSLIAKGVTGSSEADALGELQRQVETTQDVFELRTVLYGPGVEAMKPSDTWLKVGVGDQLDCTTAQAVSRLTLLGRGAEIGVKDDGSADIIARAASILNLCINRETVWNQLKPGDHGALIYAHRVVNGKTAALASFTVPVFLSVPHHTLEGSTAFDIQHEVESFAVDRNYVTVPKGTSLVRVTLEVPALKLNRHGGLASGETCSGVELMALEGLNTAKSFKDRKKARVINCEEDGSPAPDAKRSITITRSNPRPGLWDLHVFGSYRFVKSKFKLRVDYITAESDTSTLETSVASVQGQVNWKLREASMEASPDATQSTVQVENLIAHTDHSIQKGKQLDVPSAVGKVQRIYPAHTKSVTIETGGSFGNDIDLVILGCEGAVCTPVGQSGTSTDEERVTFIPKEGLHYIVKIDGFDIKDEGKFFVREIIAMDEVKGTVEIQELQSKTEFQVGFTITTQNLSESALTKSEFFLSGKYSLGGALTLRSRDRTVLGAIPLKVKQP